LSNRAKSHLCQTDVVTATMSCDRPQRRARKSSDIVLEERRVDRANESWIRASLRDPALRETQNSGGVLVWGKQRQLVGLLRVRHVRKVEGLASFRQRAPRIPQAFIMFPLLGVVCFLRQRCALGGRFPCGLTFGSHLVVSNVGPSDGSPKFSACDIQPRTSRSGAL
jgi:hypothetical protein